MVNKSKRGVSMMFLHSKSIDRLFETILNLETVYKTMEVIIYGRI